jgi:hypothetical protein
LQLENSLEHSFGKDASGERRIVSKLHAEISQLRKENDSYRTQELEFLEIRGEVESMRSEFKAKLAALTADAEQEQKLQSLPSTATKALNDALCAKQASAPITNDYPQPVPHLDFDFSFNFPPVPAETQAWTQTDAQQVGWLGYNYKLTGTNKAC